MLSARQGRPLPLITESQNSPGHFRLSTETVDYLSAFGGQCSFVSICGDYRTGKSFLLNALFFDRPAFATSASTQSCTRGITLWSQPISLPNNTHIWLIDSEGFGSTDRDPQHDGKVFLLNLLLADTLLYNSFGAIDEGGVSRLALISREAQYLKTAVGGTRLFWVLRDFSLEMRDRQGRMMDGNQYLEDCLGGQGPEKQFLKGLFGQRSCVPLVRPVIDQKQLGSLASLQRIYLRQQFKQQLGELRQQVLSGIHIKKIKGMTLQGPMLRVWLDEMIKGINSGQVDTCLSVSYQRIMAYARELWEEEVLDEVKARVKKVAKVLPVGLEHIEYLSQEVERMINEKTEDGKQKFESQTGLELSKIRMKEQINAQITTLQKQNSETVTAEISEWIQRNITELHPDLTALTPTNYEQTYPTLLTPLQQTYYQNYQQYFEGQSQAQKALAATLHRHERKIFLELTKKWKHGLTQAQKQKQQNEERVSTLEEQCIKQKHRIKQIERERDQLQTSYQQQIINLKQSQTSTLKTISQQAQEQLTQLRQQFSQLTHQKQQTQSQLQCEIDSLKHQLTLQQQATDRLALKIQQLKTQHQLQVEQQQNASDNRIQLLEMRYNQAQKTLTQERKKYVLLSEERRAEEANLLEEMMAKNIRIQELSQELAGLEEKYKEELQRVLGQQKDIIVNTINAKISDLQHQCRVYEARLTEAAEVVGQKQYFEKRTEDLELELREWRTRWEEQHEKSEVVMSRVTLLEKELTDLKTTLSGVREEGKRVELEWAEKEAGWKRMMRQMEQDHQSQIEELRRKAGRQEGQREKALIEQHQQAMTKSKANFEQQIQKERNEYKQLLKKAYEQAEEHKTNHEAVKAQLDSVNNTLQRIQGSQTEADPRQDHSMAQEVEGMVSAIKEQTHHLIIERQQLQHQLHTTSSKLAEATTELTALRKQNESMTRQSNQVKRELQRKVQLISRHESTSLDTTNAYKATILTLEQQNAHLQHENSSLTQQNHSLSNQLERFNIWAVEIKGQPGPTYHSSTHREEDRHKIKELQSEILRLSTRLQEQKLSHIHHETRREVDLSQMVSPNRQAQALQVLKKQNQQLYVMVEEYRQKELILIQQRKTQRNKQNEGDDQRVQKLREEHEASKRRAREEIVRLQEELTVIKSERDRIKQQFEQYQQSVESKYMWGERVLREQVDALKKDKASTQQYYTRRISQMEETIQAKTTEADRRRAQLELQYEAWRSEGERQKQKVVLEGERHRLKYEHIMKVNGELMKEVEVLKSKAHQITLKEKYKAKIGSLFQV